MLEREKERVTVTAKGEDRRRTSSATALGGHAIRRMGDDETRGLTSSVTGPETPRRNPPPANHPTSFSLSLSLSFCRSSRSRAHGPPHASADCRNCETRPMPTAVPVASAECSHEPHRALPRSPPFGGERPGTYHRADRVYLGDPACADRRHRRRASWERRLVAATGVGAIFRCAFSLSLSFFLFFSLARRPRKSPEPRPRRRRCVVLKPAP